MRAGVPAEELAQIGAGELALLPAEQWAAIVYAAALAEARFGQVPADARALADDQLDAGRRRDVEAVARLMTFTNLSVNTASALARRLRPARGARR